ncbi:MAG: hypothetical protein GX856_13955 [Gammaproteobacteria bacterium]|jgi:hypothetical protein|nr:hypothetical protein [Gammaproteobacteria bacterium]
MLGIAIGMFAAVFAIFTYLKPITRRRIVGYGLWLDIAVWVLFIGVFGGTGMERMSAVFASMGVTAFIHSYRWLCGYERLTMNGWVRYAGRLTPR